MKVVTRTGEYTIYRKRNQRYAIRRKDDKAWVRGEDKVAILLANNLREAPVPKAPVQPEEAPAQTAGAEEGGGEAGAGEASAAEQDEG